MQYRECISYYNKKKDTTVMNEFKAPYKVCKNWQARFVCQDAADWALNSPWPANEANTKGFFPLSRCIPCPTNKPTKAPKVLKDTLIVRRNEHGILMITAYLLLFPVSFLISRFYKETLHTSDVKGFRTWLCIHIVFCIVGMILIYIAYCACPPSQGELHLHNILGYVSVGCCIGGTLSGWVRNKGTFLLKCSIFFHAFLGYAGWGLGCK